MSAWWEALFGAPLEPLPLEAWRNAMRVSPSCLSQNATVQVQPDIANAAWSQLDRAYVPPFQDPQVWLQERRRKQALQPKPCAYCGRRRSGAASCEGCGAPS